MPSIDVKLQTHLRSYQRLLTAESDRLKSLANLSDPGMRKAVLGRLKALRLATRDLEKVVELAQRAEQPEASRDDYLAQSL